MSDNNISFITQCSPENFIMTTGGKPKYDFAILNSDKTIAYFIEYQGEQHFIARGNIFTEEKVAIIKQRDLEKKSYCEKNNIPLIYVNYTEFETFSINDIYFWVKFVFDM